jgi:hypothetical protein
MKSSYIAIIRRLKEFDESIRELEAQRTTLVEHMSFLEAQGLIYTYVYWREEKFMYLNHPVSDGKRRREYVGCKPAKIKEAKAGIARGHEYNRLKQELDEVEGRMRNANYYLDLAGNAAA